MTSWRSTWPVPIALVALGTVPVIAGALRLVELSGGTAALPSDARYHATPLPVALHIVCAAVFAILGALQFAPRLRRHGWHRRAGRVLVVAGLGVALSALWLNQWFPEKVQPVSCCTRCDWCSGWRWWSPSSSASSQPVVGTSPATGRG